MNNFEDEVKAAVDYDSSVNRITKDDEEFDEFLLEQDIPKTEENINSHFSKNNRHTKPNEEISRDPLLVHPMQVGERLDKDVDDSEGRV